jgi:hypothetical protein
MKGHLSGYLPTEAFLDAVVPEHLCMFVHVYLCAHPCGRKAVSSVIFHTTVCIYM